MKSHFSIFLLILFHSIANGQSPEITFFGGISNYVGDIQQKPFVASNAHAVWGITYKHPINQHFWVRAGFGSGKIAGWDGTNEDNLKVRNLSFESKVLDGYVAGEYRLFKEANAAIIPYAFLGIGMFHFDPYVYYGDKNEKVFLQPLGTEGQGLPEYPNRKMYKLTELIIPFGGGLLWHLNEKWVIGGELRYQYASTDYLDDVSKGYAAEAPLLRDRGPIAVELAWRRDEIDGRPYPVNGGVRGNPDVNDMYFYVGFQVGLKISSLSESGKSGGKFKMGCPKW